MWASITNNSGKQTVLWIEVKKTYKENAFLEEYISIFKNC